MQSERRRIQNLFKHLRWSVFTLTVNGLKSLTGHANHSFLDVWKGSEYASSEKQGRCNMFKKNSRRR